MLYIDQFSLNCAPIKQESANFVCRWSYFLYAKKIRDLRVWIFYINNVAFTSDSKIDGVPNELVDRLNQPVNRLKHVQDKEG